MMSLAHFPTELLAIMLFPSDSSFLYIRLWKTGDRILQHRLTHAMINLDLRPLRPQFQFPSVVSHLPRLRHFALKSTLRTSFKPNQNVSTLSMLPQTLESLLLDFPSLHLFLTNYGHASEATSAKLIETHYPLGVSRFINLNALFPKLVSLTLGKLDSGLGPSLTPSTLLSILPSSLTELCFDKLIIASAPFASLLPRNLVRLDCKLKFNLKIPNSVDLFDAVWFDAPPRLKYVKSLYLSELSFSPSWPSSSLICFDDLDDPYQALLRFEHPDSNEEALHKGC